MGAGVQRWWRDGSRYAAECKRDQQQHIIEISHAIISSKPSDRPAIRRALAALIEMWKVVLPRRS